MYSHVRFKYIFYVLVINTTIKTTSVCDGDAQCVVAGWPVILMGWPVTGDDGRGQPASQQQTLSGTGLHCTQGLAGRGDVQSTRERQTG